MVVDPYGRMDLIHEFAQRLEPVRIAEINLELRIERFLHPVLPRAAFLAPGNGDADFLQGSGERFRSVLPAVIRVEYHRMRAVVDGGDYKKDFSGTSASAPLVTGVAAILKSLKPALTPAEIKQILVANADPIFTDKPIGPRLNALRAVRKLLF